MYRLQPNQLVDGCIHFVSFLFLILFSTVIAAQDSVLLLKKLSSPDLSTRTLAMEKLKETELNTKDHDFIRKLFLTVDQNHMLRKQMVPEIQVQIELIIDLLIEKQKLIDQQKITVGPTVDLSPINESLVYALSVSQASIRMNALSALSKYHELSFTYQLLNHPESVVRQNIAYALGEINFHTQDEKFISDLKEAMKTKNRLVQLEVILALAKIKLSTEQKQGIINELINLFKSFKFYLPQDIQAKLIRSDEVRLLSLPDKYSTDLDRYKKVSEANSYTPNLNQSLQLGGLKISPDADVRIIKKGKKWQIIDPESNQIYRILVGRDDSLDIFRNSLDPQLFSAFQQEEIQLSGDASTISIPVINDNQIQSTSWMLTSSEVIKTPSASSKKKRRYFILHQAGDFQRPINRPPPVNFSPNSSIEVFELCPDEEIRRSIILVLSNMVQQRETSSRDKRLILSFLLSNMVDPDNRVCQAIAKAFKSFTQPNTDLIPNQITDQSDAKKLPLPYDFENSAVAPLNQRFSLISNFSQLTKVEEQLGFYTIMALGEIGHPSSIYLETLRSLGQENDKLQPIVTTAVGQIMNNEYRAFCLPDMIFSMNLRSTDIPKDFESLDFPTQISDQFRKKLENSVAQIPLNAQVQIRQRGQVWSIPDSQGQDLLHIQKQNNLSPYILLKKNNFSEELDAVSSGDRKNFDGSQLDGQFKLMGLRLPKNLTVQKNNMSWSIFDHSANRKLVCQIRPLDRSKDSSLGVYFRLNNQLVDYTVSINQPSVSEIRKIIDTLHQQIQKNNFINLSASLASMAKIGPNVRRIMSDTEFDSITSEVTARLNHTSASIRKNSLLCLDKMIDGDELAATTINQISLIVLQDKQNQELAIQILANQGSNAKQSLTALLEVLEKGNENIQRAILAALPHIDPVGTVEILLEYLKRNGEDVSVRVAAATALIDSIVALRLNVSSQKTNRDLSQRIIVDLVQLTTNKMPLIDAAAKKTLSSVVKKDLETKDDLALGLLKGLLYNAHSRKNKEPNFMVLPQIPTKERVLQYLNAISELPQNIDSRVLVNAARILARAARNSSQDTWRQHLYPPLFTLSRKLDSQSETVKIFQSTDWKNTFDFLKLIIEGHEESLGRPINADDRRHALNLMGQIITNFRNDKTGLDAWKDLVPVVIGRMLDEKQVGRYQQEIRKLNEKLIETGEDNPDRFETQKQITKLSGQIDINLMAVRVWGNVIAIKPKMTIESLFILTEEQRTKLERLILDSPEINRKENDSTYKVVTDLLQRQNIATLLDQYKNSIELLKDFMDYTSEFLVNRLAPNKEESIPNDEDLRQRRHALRLLVFPEQLLVPNMQGQPAPNDKLVAKLQSVLTRNPDDELVSLYRQALTRLGQ